MEGRGRKSIASLSVVAVLPGQRPEPPGALSVAEAEIWRGIVSTKPYDWFTQDTHSLLSEYCRAWVSGDQLAAELAKYKTIPKSGDRFRRWMALRDRQDKTARLITTLATKMRLSQQSRYTEKSAGTAAKNIAKPWEFGKGA
jgi:hypothetical protein